MTGIDRPSPSCVARMWHGRHLQVPGSHLGAGDLCIVRVSRCVARGFKVRASSKFARCYWCRSLAVDGRSGASPGHMSVMRRPGSRWRSALQRPPTFRAPHSPNCHTAYRRSAVPGVEVLPKDTLCAKMTL